MSALKSSEKYLSLDFGKKLLRFNFKSNFTLGNLVLKF